MNTKKEKYEFKVGDMVKWVGQGTKVFIKDLGIVYSPPKRLKYIEEQILIQVYWFSGISKGKIKQHIAENLQLVSRCG